MPTVSTPSDDPWKDRVARLERQVAELERRISQTGVGVDTEGNIVTAPDAQTGIGLGRPYLPFPWAPARPVYYDYLYASGSTIPETIWHAVIYKQHPKVVFAVETTAPAGEAGALRLLVAGRQVGGDVGFGDAPARFVFGPLLIPGEHLAAVRLELQMWRTVGTGLVRCWPQDSWAVQS